jgi:4-alpha-glucanotransferase
MRPVATESPNIMSAMNAARRRSGILLHVSSLPGACGIGDLGPAAYDFVDFLRRTGQTLWQVLPIGPIGYGNSPYQSPSAFAGNPLFVSLERLVAAGLLSSSELRNEASFSSTNVEYDRVPAWPRRRLADAFRNFSASTDAATRGRFSWFRQAEATWLDYALFTALHDSYGAAAWTTWDPDLVRRRPAALAEARRTLATEIDNEMFVQFEFAEQWTALKQYANDCGVRIVGDVPIFVAHDSADVWAHQELFQLDDAGRTTVVAGVPPDYFSAGGQFWGNPLYRWDVMAETGYAWWIERLRHSFRQFDLVRIDHFRGFESYWEVAGEALDARQGRWAPGPGIALFRVAEKALGPLPLIAEDLGLITPAVAALRDQLGAPGMRVLQFAFGEDEFTSIHLPHNFPRNCVVYTGTHDNDTTLGWFHAAPGPDRTGSAAEIESERARVMKYLGTDGREIHWDFIRAAISSTADTAIVPLQDVLGLGSEGRMNRPGTNEGNWGWRFERNRLTSEMEVRLREMTRTYERAPEFTAMLASRIPVASVDLP